MPRSAASRTPPMPLGDPWAGTCHALPGGDWRPDPNTLRELCNFGYAREKCGRVPPGSPDAVRFSISHDREGVIRIYWVVEKDHLPFAHGPLEYSRADEAFREAHPDCRLVRQAQAYISSYLRRKEKTIRP